MICPRCGNDNKDTATFCMHCGQSLIQRESVFHARASKDTEVTAKRTHRVDSTQKINKEAGSPTPGQFSMRSIPDTLREGRYIIEKQLGSGGMGRVFLAQDTMMNYPVVVKEMLPLVITRKEREYMEERFREEAQLLFRLKHQGLPRVVEYFTENESLFLIMEYVKGDNLEQSARKHPAGRISLDECLKWMRKILDILKYLHGQNPPIIHRDIKPANIMLTDGGEVMLVDFGVARAAEATTFTRVGTPGFASIDHFTGKFSPASDIYSLGATFHYLLSGDDPRNRADFQFPPLSNYRDDIPDGFQRILDKAVAIKQEDRYQTVDEMLMDLDSFRRDYSRGIHRAGKFYAGKGMGRSSPQPKAKDLHGEIPETIRIEKKSPEKHSTSLTPPIKKDIPPGKTDSTRSIASASTSSLPIDEFAEKDTGKKNYMPFIIVGGVILFLIIFIPIVLLFLGAARKAKQKKKTAKIPPVVRPGEAVFDMDLKDAEVKVYHADGQFCGLWKFTSGKLRLEKSNKNEKLSPPVIKDSYTPNKIYLKPGKYKISISRPGYHDIVIGKKEPVTLESKKPFNIEGKWISLPSISVTTNREANIFLDGKWLGKTTEKKYKIKDLKVGVTYKVAVRKAGYYDKEEKVKITEKGEVKKLSITLNRIPRRVTPLRPSYQPSASSGSGGSSSSTRPRTRPTGSRLPIRKPIGDDI